MRRTPNELQAEIDAVQARVAQAAAVARAQQSSFVFRPGGVTAGNVFATWPELYAALSLTAGVRSIQVDDSIVSPAVVPAGAYDLNGVVLSSIASFSANGGALLNFADGATVAAGILSVAPWLTVQSTSATTPVITVPDGIECNLDLNFGTLTSLGAAPFVHVASGGFLWINGNSCELGILAGVRMADFAAGAGGALVIQGLSFLHPNIFTGAGAAGVFVGVDDSTVFSVLGGGASPTLDSLAEREAYTPASNANWNNAPPTTNAEAFDRIAAKIGPIP